MSVVQLIVGTSTNLTTADVKLRDLLEGEGHTVAIVDDGAAVNISGVDLVVLSTSITAAALGTKYKTEAVPLIVFGSEVSVPTALGFTNSNVAGANGTIITISNQGHPLANGHANGAVTVTTSSQQQLGGTSSNFGGTSVQIAFRTNSGSAYMMSFVESGGTMRDGTTAPARRTFLGFTSAAVNALNATGEAFVLNAMTYTGELVTDQELTYTIDTPITREVELQAQARVVLVEPFDAEGVDTAKWVDESLGAGGTLAVTSGELRITPPSNVSGSNGKQLRSAQAYNTTGLRYFVEVAQALSDDSGTRTAFSLGPDSVGFNAGEAFWFNKGAALVSMLYRDSGGATHNPAADFTYNATTHRWWAIREQGGTIYWETSPDGETWTIRGQVTKAMSTALYVYLRALTASAVAAPGVARFDNVNVEPSDVLTYTLAPVTREVVIGEQLIDDERLILQDDFPGPIVDVSKWVQQQTGSGVSLEIVNGELVITPPELLAGNNVRALRSAITYNVTDLRYTVKIVDVLSGDQNTRQTFALSPDPTSHVTNGSVYFNKIGPNWNLSYRHNGVTFNAPGGGVITHDPDTIKYLGIYFQVSLGLVHWQVSTDGFDWTTVGTIQLGVNIDTDPTAMYVYLRAGTLNAVEEPGTAKFDDVNILSRSILQDDFSTFGLDASKWASELVGTGGAVAVSGGTLNITPPTNASGTNGGAVKSVDAWNVDGTRYHVELVQALSNHADTRTVFLLSPSGTATFVNGAVWFNKLGANLEMFYRVNNISQWAAQPVPYDPIAHRYLGISVLDNEVRWEVSNNGLNWNTLASQSIGDVVIMDPTALYVWLRATTVAAVATPGVAKFDNVNIQPLPLPILHTMDPIVREVQLQSYSNIALLHTLLPLERSVDMGQELLDYDYAPEPVGRDVELQALELGAVGASFAFAVAAPSLSATGSVEVRSTSVGFLIPGPAASLSGNVGVAGGVTFAVPGPIFNLQGADVTQGVTGTVGFAVAAPLASGAGTVAVAGSLANMRVAAPRASGTGSVTTLLTAGSLAMRIAAPRARGQAVGTPFMTLDGVAWRVVEFSTGEPTLIGTIKETFDGSRRRIAVVSERKVWSAVLLEMTFTQFRQLQELIALRRRVILSGTCVLPDIYAVEVTITNAEYIQEGTLFSVQPTLRLEQIP